MKIESLANQTTVDLSFEEFKEIVLKDYYTAILSRNCALLSRREVLSGKAKFGITGDGKELAQIAMAKCFKRGDYRSGYYRDQTLMFALDLLTPEQYFAQLYADVQPNADPHNGGRQMVCHYATPQVDLEGNPIDQTNRYNTSSDISSVAGQMPRLLGLAQASRLYQVLDHPQKNLYSKEGSEVAWGTIGNASTSEGMFFETMNAAGVMQVPMVVSIWDDGYGISVSNEHHTIKESISKVLFGMQKSENEKGIEIISVKGWDYPRLVAAFLKAEQWARLQNIPVLVHVTELTQPTGHSTSGSHERYKSKERLEWENQYDCILQFKKWILQYKVDHNVLVLEQELKQIEQKAKQDVLEAKNKAWANYLKPITTYKNQAIELLNSLGVKQEKKQMIDEALSKLNASQIFYKRDVFTLIRELLYDEKLSTSEDLEKINLWLTETLAKEQQLYSSHLYNEKGKSARDVKLIVPSYKEDSPYLPGNEILKSNFDVLFEQYPNLLAFGQDVGFLGGVNQTYKDLQAKYGEDRIFDTSIRETTIIGQGIGLAMRGFRPIAEIQYLDYVSYAYSTLSDDLACLHYRTVGKQQAPLIISTRGHRLEGIWHSGSPMATLMQAFQGINFLVPRNMTQAAGFYNMALSCEEPVFIVETLNAYRLKERLPENLGSFKTPAGLVETTRPGRDITLVTYGACWHVVMQAAQRLSLLGIEAEVIDIQSLSPFDLSFDIKKSLQKTSRLAIIDEDMPGGASAYILQQILEKQDGYYDLDSKPITITAQPHRPPYGSDGDYFTKPQVEDVVASVYAIFHEQNPKRFPKR